MIHCGLDLHQDAAMCMIAENGLKASRVAVDAMQGQPLDSTALAGTLFQALAALLLAFPDDVDTTSFRLLMTKVGVGEPLRAANDRHPPPDAA